MGYKTTPSQTSSATNNIYVDSMALTYEQSIRMPNVDSQLIRPFGSQMISGFMEMMGNMNGIKNNQYIHVEEDFIKEVVKLAANESAGGVGAAATHTIASGYKVDASNSGGVYIGTGNTTSYPVRVNDVLMFPNRVLGEVVSVSGADYTVVPLDSAKEIPAVTTDETIVILGNLVGEASSQRQSSNKRIFEYKNNIHTNRDDHEVTDRELAGKTWFDNLGESGTRQWFDEAIYDTWRRFMIEQEQMMLLGENITNTTLADTSGFGTVIGTQGLIPWMETYGNVETYNIGSFSTSDLSSLVSKLVKYEGSKNNTMWCGHTLSVEIDNLLRSTTGLTNGGVIYSSSQTDSRKIAFEFDTISWGTFKFDKKHLELFDKPWGLGASGQKFTNMGLVIPNDNIIVPQFEGGSTTVPSLRLNYLDGQGMTNGYKQWETGAFAKVPTSDTADLRVHYLCHRGFEGFGANRYGIIKAN